MTRKVVLLFNGGEDSIAAAQCLKDSNMYEKILLLNFESDFFGGQSQRLKEVAKMLNLPVMIVPIHR